MEEVTREVEDEKCKNLSATCSPSPEMEKEKEPEKRDISAFFRPLNKTRRMFASKQIFSVEERAAAASGYNTGFKVFEDITVFSNFNFFQPFFF